VSGLAQLQRARARGRISALVAVAAVLASGVAATNASAGVADDLFGVNVQQVFSGSTSSWQPRLAAIANGGVQLGRIDARWSNVEPNAPTNGSHTYNWAMYDAIAQAMAQHGIRWYPIVDYSTSWSGVTAGDSNSAVAPDHVSDFTAYAAAFAQRYGRGGSFWKSHPSLPQLPVTSYEIWNEENSTVFWRPQDDAPERYADLYMAARDAIKAVDSQADVVVGGLALGGYGGGADEITFLQRMFAHRPDLKDHVDGVGLHPYQADVADTEMRIARFRQALDQLAGPQVPIEVTEVGWATTAVSDADRGADLAQLAQDLPRSDCNIDRFIPYTWITEEQDGSNSEQWFGIANADGTVKASGQGYLNAVQTMEGPSAPTGTVTICHQTLPTTPISSLPPSTGPHPGPRLILRVRQDRRRSQLEVRGTCPSGCRLQIDLLKGRAETASVKLASKQTPFSSRRQIVRLRLPRRLGRNAKLVVVATGKTGGSTTRTRGLRIR
jgi:polysaccharide biosynthesis protein PslG